MLSSLAVIQPGNERFSGVCFSSRAPFAEVGLWFCAGIPAATAWGSGTCCTSRWSCWEWCCLCCCLNCVSSSQDHLKWIQCRYRLRGLENEILWFYPEHMLPGLGQKQTDDFASESFSALTFKDWLLGHSGHPCLVDVSLLGCCDCWPWWLLLLREPVSWDRLRPIPWIVSLTLGSDSGSDQVLLETADGLKPAHWPGLSPHTPKIFENL